jgi:hypothetical protein
MSSELLDGFVLRIAITRKHETGSLAKFTNLVTRFGRIREYPGEHHFAASVPVIDFPNSVDRGNGLCAARRQKHDRCCAVFAKVGNGQYRAVEPFNLKRRMRLRHKLGATHRR